MTVLTLEEVAVRSKMVLQPNHSRVFFYQECHPTDTSFPAIQFVSVEITFRGYMNKNRINKSYKFRGRQ